MIDLGRGVHDGKLEQQAVVQVPLSMMNRHGLVAGRDRHGQDQDAAGHRRAAVSAQGVPVFVADVKGDVSGLAVPGRRRRGRREADDRPRPAVRADGLPDRVPVARRHRARACRCARRSRTSGRSCWPRSSRPTRRRSRASSLVFHYADSKSLPLLDLSDLRALLTFLDSDAGKAELEGIGGLAKATVGVLLRALVGLEDGGGNEFFGEPQLDINDLLRTAPDGRGVISVLELPAVQDKPALFSTALMWLVAELFETLPEAGDLPKPKLVFFLDEAHLLFDGATDAFVQSVEQTVRLIRSKGVGVFFVTQTPKDLPESVLAQLGNRVQHALRAFTPDDAKALKATVSTFPKSDFYDIGELLTQMGIGEAAVTILSENGVPTPVAHTRLRAPASRMAPADDVDGAAKASPLFAKYGTRTDAQSAREMLAARVDAPPPRPPPRGAPRRRPSSRRRRRRRSRRPRRSATSSTRARARRCRSRSCAACSGC